MIGFDEGQPGGICIFLPPEEDPGTSCPETVENEAGETFTLSLVVLPSSDPADPNPALICLYQAEEPEEEMSAATKRQMLAQATAVIARYTLASPR